MSTVKWNEKTHSEYEKDIAAALLHYILKEDKEKAKSISYGDLGRILQKAHGSRYHGDNDVTGTPKGVVVRIPGNKYFMMTWNKAAKIIHKYAGVE